MENNELIISKEYGIGTLSEQALYIRQTVFVKEEGVPLDIELDDFDNLTTHYIGRTADQPVTTARVLFNEHENSWHIQRVATLSEARGNGYASKLMQTIITDAREAGIHHIELGAQVHAQSFYEHLNFKTIGEPYTEAGIEHIEMELKI